MRRGPRRGLVSHGMRPFGALISKEDALARLVAAAHPVARVEEIPLVEAAGRVAARDILAPFDVPPFARATMDGYAVRAADAGARRIVGEALAGGAHQADVGEGDAIRIATGAPVPRGADAVIRVEDATESDATVIFARAPRRGESIDGAGSDVARGARVVGAGDALTPARIGLVASLGAARITVREKPRVALFSSGDELLQPGEPPSPHKIFDSNSTTLAALLRPLADARTLPALRDDEGAQRKALRDAAASHDLILITGGASVGRKDHAAAALAAEGEVLFHGVRVKPGKPLLAGRIGDALVIGLPGNPTSALSNAHLFVLPAVRKMSGLAEPAERLVAASLAEAVVGQPDRYQFLPVRLESGRAIPTFKTSGALTSLAASDGWIGIPEGASLAAGARVEVHPW